MSVFTFSSVGIFRPSTHQSFTQLYYTNAQEKLIKVANTGAANVSVLVTWLSMSM